MAESRPTWFLTPEQQGQLALEGNNLPLIYNADGTTSPNPNYDSTAGSTKNLGVNPAAGVAQQDLIVGDAKSRALLQGAQIEMDRANQADKTTNVAIARGLLNSSISTKDLQDVEAAASMRKQALTTSLALITGQAAIEKGRIMGAANVISQTAANQGVDNAQRADVTPPDAAASGQAPAAGTGTTMVGNRPVSGGDRPAPVQPASMLSGAIQQMNPSGVMAAISQAPKKPKKPKVTTSSNGWRPGLSVSGY